MAQWLEVSDAFNLMKCRGGQARAVTGARTMKSTTSLWPFRAVPCDHDPLSNHVPPRKVDKPTRASMARWRSATVDRSYAAGANVLTYSSTRVLVTCSPPNA